MKILPVNHERFWEVWKSGDQCNTKTCTEKLLCARHLAGEGWFRELYDGVCAFKELPVQRGTWRPEGPSAQIAVDIGAAHHWVLTLFCRHTVG